MQVNIKDLIDDAQCYDTVCELRWPESRACPFYNSKRVIRKFFNKTEPSRQHYQCKECGNHFNDLTKTIFAGHHQPLKVWIVCLYFMGLNLSNGQSAKELSLNRSDVFQMTTQLRDGVEKKDQT